MCSTPPRKETSASSVSSDLSPWGPSEVCHDDDGSIPLARPFVICRNERTQCIKLRFRIHRQGLVVPRSQPAAAHVVLTSPHLTSPWPNILTQKPSTPLRAPLCVWRPIAARNFSCSACSKPIESPTSSPRRQTETVASLDHRARSRLIRRGRGRGRGRGACAVDLDAIRCSGLDAVGSQPSRSLSHCRVYLTLVASISARSSRF
jgi:hypothetical protein